MATVYNYSVVFAIPDRGRGERVNVGLVVFLEDRLDIRLTDLQKIRALTGHDWSKYGEQLSRYIHDSFPNPSDYLAVAKNRPSIDRVFQLSATAWFSAKDEGDYGRMVQQILGALVLRPRPDPRPRGSGLNTQIAWYFNRLKLLGTAKDLMEDHKLFRDVPIEDGIHADFVQMNGLYRVVATLDLRRPKPEMRDAALKALTLDRARHIPDQKTKAIGVIASNGHDAPDVKSQVGLMEKYAEDIFQWEDPSDRKRLTNYVVDGARVHGSLGL